MPYFHNNYRAGRALSFIRNIVNESVAWKCVWDFRSFIHVNTHWCLNKYTFNITYHDRSNSWVDNKYINKLWSYNSMFATAWPRFHKSLQVITLYENNLFINRYHLFFKENILSLCPRIGILLLLSCLLTIVSYRKVSNIPIYILIFKVFSKQVRCYSLGALNLLNPQ